MNYFGLNFIYSPNYFPKKGRFMERSKAHHHHSSKISLTSIWPTNKSFWYLFSFGQEKHDQCLIRAFLFSILHNEPKKICEDHSASIAPCSTTVCTMAIHYRYAAVIERKQSYILQLYAGCL